MTSATVENSRSGFFGEFGGRFVAETLMPALEELEHAYAEARKDPVFSKACQELLAQYVGRPTPLYHAKQLSNAINSKDQSFNVWLKREDLCHTGAHKINNTIGQVLLAKRMGKPRVIAETGAGQHGVATATAAALLGLECEIFMGAEDVERQAPNVQRMHLLGAKVHPVSSGSATLKDAMNEAMRDWVTHVDHTYYCVGSVAGPHPYPSMVRDFQAIIGCETRMQCLEQIESLPDAVVACVGGGSNAMGIFCGFTDDKNVDLIGVEAAGSGVESGKHSATIGMGSVGVLHGARSMVLQSEDGQIQEAHSISAGLDYPGVGPEHAYLASTKRARYVSVTDDEALAGFRMLARAEGILAALETSHALAYLPKLYHEWTRDRRPTTAISNIVLCLSGRGDKDLGTVEKYLSSQEKPK